jgi:hypothetical protein
MAKNLQNTSQNVNNNFSKGLNKDYDPSLVQEGMWTHARNASNNTIEGDVGSLSNESANFICGITGATMPLTVVKKYIIGVIQIFSDKWLIFTAGHNALGQSVSSEIGLLEEESCLYRPIVQDKCLGFDKRFLITGSSKENEDCSWSSFFADGNNPDRYINIGDPKTWPSSDYQWVGTTVDMNYYFNGVDKILWPNVQWYELCKDSGGCEQTEPGVWPPNCPGQYTCITCTPINKLNCDKLRLARLMDTPCLNVTLGTSGGTLRNGSYFATIAYSIKGQKVTDYFSQSNVQQIWTPNNTEGSLLIEVNADNVNFSEFILVVVQNINQGTVAKQIGIYSTKTNKIELDQIKEDLITVPLEQLPLQTPVFEKSDQITDVNSYLIRVGPTSKFDFNYQPLANLIKAKWASVEYPASYYIDGGNKGSYLRDEVQPFFIRWVYDTGDKSASYHIPGRAPSTFLVPTNNTVTPEQAILIDQNSLTADDQVFEVYNTASSAPTPGLIGTILADGGKVIDAGNMGYWESTERYPDNQAEIWNASAHCWTGVGNLPDTAYDLCGLPIRHHKFPDNYLNTNTIHFEPNPSAATQGDSLNIRIMGVYFENIIMPKDNDGYDIPGIVGYEILKGSREGNKSIIAKGMINNMRSYALKGTVARGREGLYPNYPFNTILPLGYSTTIGDHNYLANDPYIRMQDPANEDDVLNQQVPSDIITFHSPDTMFRTPYLSTTELKLYGYLSGFSTQQFIEPDQHPKFKLLSDASVIVMFLGGITEAIISFIGRYNKKASSFTSPGYASDATGATIYPIAVGGAVAGQAAATAYDTAITAYYAAGGSIIDLFSSIFSGTKPTLGAINTIKDTALNTAVLTGGVAVSGDEYTYTVPNLDYLPIPLRILGGLNQALYYFSEGADVTLNIIYTLLPYRQFALQSVAHGFYSNMTKENMAVDILRFKTDLNLYIRDAIQELPRYQDSSGIYHSYSINNLKRSDTVVIRTTTGANLNQGPKLLNIDQSLVTLGTLVQHGTGSNLPDFENQDTPFSLPIASHYAAIKVRLRNQYGQLQGIKQIVISPCEQKINLSGFEFQTIQTNINCPTLTLGNPYLVFNKLSMSPIFFGGDTYINRYTEKNTMFYFYDWLYGQPDGFEYNYYLHQMIPSPRFAVNSIKYEVSDLSPSNFNSPTPGTGSVPTSFYNLDYYAVTNINPNRYYDYTDDTLGGFPDTYPGILGVKESKFYLANSAVRDFFVESDVLVDFREPGLTVAEKNYDPYRYTDYISMFNMKPEIITAGNWYRYDYSLSAAKAYTQYFSAGNLQSRYYDPSVSSLCYTYYPDRLYYSLQQQEESFKDSWFVFLPNNYKEFRSQISGVKSINKSGLFITFKNDSPLMYQGVDTLQTDLGTKITIGDGGLFSQPQQSVSNADKPYEYGSSQSKLSVVSTPAGLFYISQNQGKIFNYADGLKEISQTGLKWWFSLFLPYQLTQDFPNYPYKDNPVAGIGCQGMYDNMNSVLYFSKKDFKLKEKYKDQVQYIPVVTTGKFKGRGDYFTLNGTGRYELGDEFLFEDASWTISYDPKNQFWISFHDWHPELSLPTKTTFLTTKNNTLWKHNEACDYFCNYYGVDYPFEIELPIITGKTVTTIKSVEYILECYRRSSLNCVDQFQVLDFNFNKAVVFNFEQVSGYLNLNIFPKNNITLSLQYPIPNPAILVEPDVQPLPGFEILFSKEENKYRFNQFWDMTRDRGEFPIGSSYPPTGPLVPGTTELLGNYSQEYLWVTQPNGYIKTLNPNNLDINKAQLQRKKFRHYLNFLHLRRDVSGNVNMILKLTESKNQLSLR